MTCDLSVVTSHMSDITCHISHVTYHMSPVTCHMSHITYHISHVTYHLSPVTCHLSPVTCHLSPVTCHLSSCRACDRQDTPLVSLARQVADIMVTEYRIRWPQLINAPIFLSGFNKASALDFPSTIHHSLDTWCFPGSTKC